LSAIITEVHVQNEGRDWRLVRSKPVEGVKRIADRELQTVSFRTSGSQVRAGSAGTSKAGRSAFRARTQNELTGTGRNSPGAAQDRSIRCRIGEEKAGIMSGGTKVTAIWPPDVASLYTILSLEEASVQDVADSMPAADLSLPAPDRCKRQSRAGL
jgi:hypothetical protein